MKEMGKTGWLVEAAANHTTLCFLPSFLLSSSFQILPFVSTDKWRPSDAKREKERKSEKKVKTILFLSVSNNGGREQRYSELMVVSAFAAFAVLLFPSLFLSFCFRQPAETEIFPSLVGWFVFNFLLDYHCWCCCCTMLMTIIIVITIICIRLRWLLMRCLNAFAVFCRVCVCVSQHKIEKKCKFKFHCYSKKL